ncbi:MAG: hypothetical protein OXC92_00950 [Flavobacteriaceae bacterium]|nr:hypothetical protein [Flavobacteriaceae bacterium]
MELRAIESIKENQSLIIQRLDTIETMIKDMAKQIQRTDYTLTQKEIKELNKHQINTTNETNRQN